MKFTEKIFVAGHRGMVGSAIIKQLNARGYFNIITQNRSELDLTQQNSVNDFFKKEKPQHVFLAAAKVGGIHANNLYRADFIYENLMIQNNLIHAAHANSVERLLFLGSSCIYPKNCPQPIKEQYLLTGSLESTNQPYAIAKISGIEMCWSYNRQYSTQFMAVMPTNLYGPGDNYHPENSHVIPALIQRAHQHKIQNIPKLEVWGSGRPRREFLYSEDMADACVHLMQLSQDEFSQLFNDDTPPLINIGSGADQTIAELAALVCSVVGYEGEIVFDASKPDGTMRKLMDSQKMYALGWGPKTSMRAGLQIAYADYLNKTSQI
jgi:GDP-L-fucose synthase